MTAGAYLGRDRQDRYRTRNSEVGSGLPAVRGWSGQAEGIMRQKRGENCRTGSGAGAAIFLIFALIVLAIVRSLWFAKADGHYDKVISAYIAETEDYEDEDKDELRRRLLEDGMFIKIFRWDKKSFVKDEQLYDEMIKASNEQQRKKEAEVGGFVEDLINL